MRRWFSCIGAATLIALAGAVPALGNDAGVTPDERASGATGSLAPEVSVEVQPAEGLSPGDSFTLRIRVKAAEGIEIAVPEQSLGPFEVLDRKATPPGKAGDPYVFELTLISFESGALEVPSLTVRAVSPEGQIENVRTEPRSVRIASLVENEPNAEPKGPSAPVAVSEDDFTLAWIAGAIAFAALIAAITLYISRVLKRRPKAPEPAPPPRPAFDVAVEKLLLLSRDKDRMLADGRGVEFVDSVGDVLREYLGHRYGFDGLESTTDEIVSTLTRLRPHNLSLSGVTLVLEQCDLVKFARANPDGDTCSDLWNGAMGLVRSSRPPVEQRPPDGALGGTT